MSITVSYSELDNYRQCPLKHHLSNKLGYRREETREQLSRGKLWHKVMEIHYTRFKGGANDISALLHEPDGKQTDEQELVEWMYKGYVQAWGFDSNWEVLAVEMPFRVPLPSIDGKRTSNRYFLKGYIDLIVRDQTTGRIWVVDHKSADRLLGKTEIDLDDQFGLYQWAVGKATDWQVMGSIHNCARTHRNKSPMALDSRFARTPMFRSTKELHNLAWDATLTAQAAYSGVQVRSSPNPQQCKWKCDLLDVHLAMRKGIPAGTALRDFGFTSYKGAQA